MSAKVKLKNHAIKEAVIRLSIEIIKKVKDNPIKKNILLFSSP